MLVESKPWSTSFGLNVDLQLDRIEKIGSGQKSSCEKQNPYSGRPSVFGCRMVRGCNRTPLAGASSRGASTTAGAHVLDSARSSDRRSYLTVQLRSWLS